MKSIELSFSTMDSLVLCVLCDLCGSKQFPGPASVLCRRSPGDSLSGFENRIRVWPSPVQRAAMALAHEGHRQARELAAGFGPMNFASRFGAVVLMASIRSCHAQGARSPGRPRPGGRPSAGPVCNDSLDDGGAGWKAGLGGWTQSFGGALSGVLAATLCIRPARGREHC